MAKHMGPKEFARSVKAHKGVKKPKHSRKLKSVSIDVAETGYIGRRHYDPSKSKDGGMAYEEPEQHALPDLDAAHKFVKESLGK